MQIVLAAWAAVGLSLPSSPARCGPIVATLRSDTAPVAKSADVQLAADAIQNAIRKDMQRAEITTPAVMVGDAASDGVVDDGARRVELVGGGTVTRSIAASVADVERWISSPTLSDSSLLNTVSYEALGNDCYRCQMVRIAMFSYRVTPLLTVRIERDHADSGALLIRAVDVSISIQNGRGAKPWLLSGARVASTNCISWRADGDATTELQTELRLRVSVELPRRLPLPRAAVERPGSLILQATCDAQCRQLLAEIEAGFLSAADQRRLG